MSRVNVGIERSVDSNAEKNCKVVSTYWGKSNDLSICQNVENVVGEFHGAK
jgi:hypothetical protein